MPADRKKIMRKQTHRNGEGSKDYFCAEFQLKESRTLFQFKLRKESSGDWFAVFKKGSKALENLKQGDELKMKYYCLDKSVPADIRKTRIKYVNKSSGFRDHYTIGLEIDSESLDSRDPFPGLA